MPESRLRRMWSRLRTVFWVVLCTFVSLEVVSYIYLTRFASESKFTIYASLRQLQSNPSSDEKPAAGFAPHRHLGIIPTSNYKRGGNIHNALGYRGPEIIQPKPADEFRIVCIGGSTTYTTAASWENAYPNRLQEELRSRGRTNVLVVNAGIPSATTWESLTNFEFRVIDLDPDLVLIYHAANDLESRFVWPPEAYLGDNSGWRVLDEHVVSMPAFWEYSTSLRMFAVEFGLIKPHAAFTRSIVSHAPTWYFDQYYRQKDTGTYPQGIFETVDATQMLETNKPIYFRRNIEHLIALAEYREIQPVLVTFAYSKFFGRNMTEYHGAHDEMNEVIRDIGRDNDVPVLDFASAFPNDVAFYVDSVHLNARGAARKAEILAEMLVAEGLL